MTSGVWLAWSMTHPSDECAVLEPVRGFRSPSIGRCCRRGKFVSATGSLRSRVALL